MRCVGIWPIVLLVAGSSLHSAAIAKYREPCTLKYETRDGWSEAYQVDCIYITGFELNTVTGTVLYQSLSAYAVVFWAQNQATVIRMEMVTACGFEASDKCASYLYMPVRGVDQEGRNWKVCSAGVVICN